MRARQSFEQLTAVTEPIMYQASFVPETAPSSFPSGWEAGPFSFRSGWTRLGAFFADGYHTREEMRELVHNRFGVKL